ncbi:uncharacterized protein FA14DRAFT_162608 [Meira miltonrushii]|uniref:NAD(P)-binding protein n=1 Tax=Meira miltonrushii TaxID=1280837 RepID=A0A316V642_9BASI|nr:uncharacterized protein FA14DRAFT_162608 [Meira miltonrushii]PWN31673.1 hypothetical protein FA14DRAFT_162608 [Meira miltonrushii]
MDCFPQQLLNLVTGRSNAGNIKLTTELSQGPVDILALGSGWTWSFLGPAAGEAGLRTISTTRNGGNGTIPFTFDPESDDKTPFESLPDAKTVIVIFPLYSADAAKRLVNGYISTRSEAYSMTPFSEKAVDTSRARFILLGSTGIYGQGGPTLQNAPCNLSSADQSADTLFNQTLKKGSHQSPWFDRNSKIDDVPRSRGENAFLEFNQNKDAVQTSVLCLSGLWGHGRSLRRYVGRIAPTRERLAKLGSVHFIHGHDLARALLAMHDQWNKAAGQRWILTNERVYDLWDLISQWGNAGEDGRDHIPQGLQPIWVQELINESRKSKKESTRIRALPRTPEQLGYALDSSDFWSTFGLFPEVPWVD